MKRDLAALKDQFGDDRRTRIEEVAATREIDWSAMIEKEPITVILSQRGWIRAMRGHVALDDAETLKFREGDGLDTIFHAQTTDRLALFAANGRVYTLGGDKLPGGRGFGEPVRLSIDLDAEVDIVALMVVRPETKLLVASSDGKGFLTSGEATLAETRKGKQLVNLRTGAKVAVVRQVPQGADTVGVVGENRKMLIFPSPNCRSLRGVRASRCSATATADCPMSPPSARRRVELGIGRRKRADKDRNGPDSMARGAGRRGPDAADWFPSLQ